MSLLYLIAQHISLLRWIQFFLLSRVKVIYLLVSASLTSISKAVGRFLLVIPSLRERQ